MPNRILRDWTDSYAVDALDANAERFFTRLIMVVDDYGRFHADPRMLRSKCFPLKTDVRDTDVARWLAACEKTGIIRCYRDDRARQLLEIAGFKQRSRSPSRFPDPSEVADQCPTNDGQMSDACTASAHVFVVGDVVVVEDAIRPPAGSGSVLPANWRNIPKIDRRNHRVLQNNRMMERIGTWFNRKPTSLWTLAEGIALAEIKPDPDDVDALESYYLAPIDKDDDYRRRDLITLLNNWNGELDRARIFKAENP